MTLTSAAYKVLRRLRAGDLLWNFDGKASFGGSSIANWVHATTIKHLLDDGFIELMSPKFYGLTTKGRDEPDVPEPARPLVDPNLLRRIGRKIETGTPIDLTTLPIYDGCMIWTGTRSRAGYAQVRFAGRLLYLHQVLYEAYYGPLNPHERLANYVCGNKACVNPKHWRDPALNDEQFSPAEIEFINAFKSADLHHDHKLMKALLSGVASIAPSIPTIPIAEVIDAVEYVYGTHHCASFEELYSHFPVGVATKATVRKAIKQIGGPIAARCS